MWVPLPVLSPRPPQHGIFGSWLEAGGCSEAEPSPGVWSGSVFHRHLWEQGGFFSTNNFIEKAVGLFLFSFFFSLFPVNSHPQERDFPSPLCIYLKTGKNAAESLRKMENIENIL